MSSRQHFTFRFKSPASESKREAEKDRGLTSTILHGPVGPSRTIQKSRTYRHGQIARPDAQFPPQQLHQAELDEQSADKRIASRSLEREYILQH